MILRCSLRILPVVCVNFVRAVISYKIIFGYKKYDSITKTLLETGLPSFDTVCANASFNFHSRWPRSKNSMVTMLRACLSY